MSLITDGTCLQVRLGRPGTRAKVSSSEVEVQTDKTMLHVSKDLMDSPELKAISAADALTRAWVRSVSVPTPYLRGGLYMVKMEAVPTIDAGIEEKRAARLPLVDKFIEAYSNQDDGIIARAKARLDTLFDPADYPTADAMRKAFTFETAYLAIGTPGNLQQISKVIFEREKEKAALRLRDAEEEIKLLLRTEMKTLVDGLVEMLKPTDDGKKKKFMTARVQKVSDFLGTFQFRNIVDDAELTGIIDQARTLLSGRDPAAIKESAVLTQEVATGFADLQQALLPLVGNVSARMIDLDESEEES